MHIIDEVHKFHWLFRSPPLAWPFMIACCNAVCAYAACQRRRRKIKSSLMGTNEIEKKNNNWKNAFVCPLWSNSIPFRLVQLLRIPYKTYRPDRTASTAAIFIDLLLFVCSVVSTLHSARCVDFECKNRERIQFIHWNDIEEAEVFLCSVYMPTLRQPINIQCIKAEEMAATEEYSDRQRMVSSVE